MTTTPKQRPILFSGPMVRAILDGKKTQTRRPVRPQPDHDIDDLHGGDFRRRAPYAMECDETGRSTGFGFEDNHGHRWQCPFGPPGTLLWVRETWCPQIVNGLAHHLFKASWPQVDKHGIATPAPTFRWRPSTTMPRWASRITLRNKRTWVERVQDISEEDARAEGMDANGPVWSDRSRHELGPHRYQFMETWARIYGAESWKENHWVWACEFERVKP